MRFCKTRRTEISRRPCMTHIVLPYKLSWEMQKALDIPALSVILILEIVP